MAIKAIINNTEKEIEQIKSSNEQDIDYVYSRIGDTEVEGALPISIKSIGGNLSNYRIYGNMVGGESVGDLVAEGEHAGEYKVAVKVEGKNLCNNIWEQKAINAETGKASPNWTTVCCDFIPVKPNVTYSCSRTIWNNYNNLRCYGTNKNYLGTGADLANKTNPLPQGASFGTFMITDARVSYIRFNDFSNSLDTKYMLVEGVYTAETMPPYEPYYEPVTTNLYLPEPIKMVGDEAEYIDYAEQKLHRVRKNLLQNTVTSTTVNGVAFTANSDGSVICNGTANGNTALFWIPAITLPAGQYSINGCPAGGTENTTYKILIIANNEWRTNDMGSGANFTLTETSTVSVRIAIYNGYTCNNLTFYPMIRKADIEDDTYEPYIKNTELDVTLPALSTIKGINTFSVNTSIQPSNIYVKDNFDYKKVFTATRTIEGELPLNYRSIEDNDSTLSNYRVYGNTVNGESVGDLVTDSQSEHYGEYTIPITNNSETANIYLDEPLRKVGDEAEYVDYAEQKWHRVRKNLLKNTVTSQTINGVTFTVNSDGSFTCNGTASNTTVLNFIPSAFSLPEGAYILNGAPPGGGWNNKFKLDVRLSTNIYYADIGNGIQFNILQTETIATCRIVIYSGYTCDNLTFYPMIRKADITDDTYEPYIENTEVDVTLPALPTLTGTNVMSVGTEAQPSNIYLKGKIKKKPKIYYKIYYYSQDGQTLLYTESVLKGSNGMYSGTPTKMADPQYTYTFAGWSSSTGQTTATPEVRNNIQNDKNVYAAFSQTLNTYTVYFYNESDTPIETVQNVPYGGTATYTGATPTSSQAGYIFSGWSPSNTNITADTSCYAQFEEDDMYESITDTWSQIIANVSNGTYSTKYHIGDTKKIDLGTEGEVIMTIVGIDTDDLADNSGKAPITWISKQLLKTDHRMNPPYSSGTEGTGSLGGWEKTEMRSYLKETVKPLIPETVRNAIKPVKKYSKIYNVSGSTVNDALTTEDVWIPSYKEVLGSGLETLGPTYSTTFPDNASRIKSKAGSDAARWWLRSAYYASNFTRVGTDGSNTNYYANSTGGVALGFCLGAPTYTVTYYSQDGQTVLSTETVEEGHDCTYSTVPTKESDTDFDYTFTGWSTSTNSTTATAGATENIQQNTNLYAAFSKSFKTDTISDSWEEIIANCDNGTYASKYQIGDLKTIDVGTEGPVQMQIVAIDTDLLASDNTKKAPITWISKQLLNTYKTMHRTPSNYLSDWANCDMRTYLRGTILPMLPSVVQNGIKEVTKYTCKRTSSTTWTTVSATENIWLPSYREVSNATSNCETSGVQYNSIFTNNASRVKSKTGNSAYYWWTRSASGESNSVYWYCFAGVDSNGSASYGGYYCTLSSGVAIGFCT